MTIKSYFLSTSSHAVLGYMITVHLIDEWLVMKSRAERARIERQLHEAAARKQGIKV